MPSSEQAIVRPLPAHEWQYTQSRFDHVPRTPFRILVSGKSASGKGVLTVAAVTDFYAGCFDNVFVFAATVHVDSTWRSIEHFVLRTIRPTNRAPFMYDRFDEGALKAIIEVQKLSIKQQKDDPDRKGPLKGALIIIDDLSHDNNLRKMQGGVSWQNSGPQRGITAPLSGQTCIASTASAPSRGGRQAPSSCSR